MAEHVDLDAIAESRPFILHGTEPMVTIPAASRDALVAVARGGLLADRDGHCVEMVYADAVSCVDCWPENPGEWCGWCQQHDTLAPFREDT